MQNSGQGVKSALAKRQLMGHSGCHIFLMTYRNRTFIRKISMDHDYNARLQRQRNIMISLASLGIPIPEVFGSGMENGKFYFDMEYINSTVLSKYIFEARYFEMERMIHQIFNLIGILKANQTSSVDQSHFVKKIAELKVHTEIANSSYFTRLLSEIESHDWRNIPLSPCHGDLTFENILATDSGPVVIDTLDSFASSWLVDLSKLYQDSLLWWAYRDQRIDRSMQVRLASATELLNAKKKTFGLSEYECKSIRQLIILNALRIVPYLKTSEHKSFLMLSLKEFEASGAREFLG